MFVLYSKNKNKVPIKIWLEDVSKIENSCLEQAMNLSKLPFVFKHISLMPDTHAGYGMPIGGVMATEGVVIPNSVGVDIGCGMSAVKTSLTEIDTDTLKKIMGEIRKVIPVGFDHNKEKQDEKLMPTFRCIKGDENWEYPICWVEYESACYQLGTLGGGNHFIEIQKGSDGYIWIMVHSGSRNLGFKVAQYYHRIATELNKKWHSSIPKSWLLSFLPLNSEEGKLYLEEMNYCLDFAEANRLLMINRILHCFKDVLGESVLDELRDIHHNYASMENHFGKNVMVHRKGATLARDNVGIIPGSQGSKSYIVKGKSNPESFHSCSHGAGRVMGRKEAKRVLDLEIEKKILDDQGIIHSIRNQENLDEATSAYKDINVVMENQKDLVDILVELKPLAVIKG